MTTLFEHALPTNAPLADRLRPSVLGDVVGQSHVIGPEGTLSQLLTQHHLPNLILWGPPGCGKTTIARLLADEIDYEFTLLSAVSGGAADLKEAFAKAAKQRSLGRRTLVMVDEIHRFNRAQQDILLPYIEDGTATLVGATTENPSFELNGALLSRCKVITLKRLDDEALGALFARAQTLLDVTMPITDQALGQLITFADGDGRYFLNMCEELFALFAISSEEKTSKTQTIDLKTLTTFLNKRAPLYDKNHDEHYNLISALHKSLRGSDVNAALYWFARMLNGGEEPLYIARRLVRFAVEDIGTADPHALIQAKTAEESYRLLGSPEGELALAQAVVYLATAPKSNAVYSAYKAAIKAAQRTGSLPPPKHIMNAPTALMKQEGYKEGYQYDHDTPHGFSGQNYFPENMQREAFYAPFERGFERDIKKRLSYWEKLREEQGK